MEMRGRGGGVGGGMRDKGGGRVGGGRTEGVGGGCSTDDYIKHSLTVTNITQLTILCPLPLEDGRPDRRMEGQGGGGGALFPQEQFADGYIITAPYYTSLPRAVFKTISMYPILSKNARL